jgi:hypothetical protein
MTPLTGALVISYSCVPDVTWMVESDGVRVVTLAGGLRTRLEYPEAALWDFIVRGISAARTTAMMKHIGAFATDEDTQAFVADRLHAWQQRGLIAARPSDDHGEPLTDTAL